MATAPDLITVRLPSLRAADDCPTLAGETGAVAARTLATAFPRSRGGVFSTAPASWRITARLVTTQTATGPAEIQLRHAAGVLSGLRVRAEVA